MAAPNAGCLEMLAMLADMLRPAEMHVVVSQNTKTPKILESLLWESGTLHGVTLMLGKFC